MFDLENKNGKKSTLEHILNKIPFTDSHINFIYSETEYTKREMINSSVYLLQVKIMGDNVSGCYVLKQETHEVPLIFSRRFNPMVSQTKYFTSYFKNYLYLSESNGDEKAIKIPLKKTNLLMRTGNLNVDGPDSSWSPYPILGIEGKKGVYPLVLVHETEKGIECLGICQKKGNIIFYKHTPGYRPNDDEIKEFLKKRLSIGVEKDKQNDIKEEYSHDDESPYTSMVSTKPLKKQSKKLEPLINEEINWEEPKTIVSYLDKYVIGQEYAKKVIAVTFSSYMIKYKYKDEELEKSNTLLIGPSGVGKTYMISLLAEKASLPIVQTKLTGKSSEGYWGENLSGIFKQMREKIKEETPYGIIFIDEIDKIVHNEWGSRIGFGDKLQNELIGWLEDAKVNSSEKYWEYNYLNTKNILFIAAGAFHGLNKESSLVNVIKKRLGTEYRQQNEEKEDYILLKTRPEDLIEYGLKPELVGRLTSIGILNPLTFQDKVNILVKAEKSILKHYKKLLEYKKYGLEINNDVYDIIAKRCPDETGARALKSICNDLFTNILYEPEKFADDNKVIKLTQDLAQNLIKLYK